MASLQKIQENWEGYAQADAMWAICVDPDKLGRRWTPEEFYATGEREIRQVMEYVQLQGLSPIKTAAALDFGCGIGRLTRALSLHFNECWGVDISPTMIKMAKEFNKNNARCNFWLNETDKLSKFPDRYFGFIYTSITLQHIPKRYVRKYLLELMRVLRPGGIFIFQIPDHDNTKVLDKVKGAIRFRTRLRRLLKGKRLDTLHMEMNCYPEQEVRSLISRQSVRIVDVRLTNATDGRFNGNIQFLSREPEHGWVSKQYCVLKMT